MSSLIDSNGQKNVNKKFSLGYKGISTVDMIIIVLSSIAFIAALFFLIKNLDAEKKLKLEIEGLNQSIEASYIKINTLNALIDKEDEIKEELEYNSTLLPSSKDMESVIKDINTVVSNTRVKLNDIVYENTNTLKNNVKAIPVKIKMNCTYEQMNNFIEAFNNMQRLYVISSVSILNSQKGLLNVELQLSAFYR